MFLTLPLLTLEEPSATTPSPPPTKWLMNMLNTMHQLSNGILTFDPSVLQRMKIISDLLISVSKAERQEARLKVRQDSLRLGNVGVIRYAWIILRNYLNLR